MSASDDLTLFDHLPLESTKNNKHFHKLVDLHEFQDIVRASKIDVLPKYSDYTLWKDRYTTKLFKVRKKIDKYLGLLENLNFDGTQEPHMILEVIWGFDIKVDKKCIPYVEISQKTETMPEISDRSTFGSVILTDEYSGDQYSKSIKSRKNSIPLEQQEFDSKLFLTPIVKLKDVHKPEWWICYRLAFNR
jgi:hypothetical protein